MHARAPDIQPGEGPLVWSKIPEFAVTYNGYSAVIPYVEYYLNSVINQVRKEYCSGSPALAEMLATFIKQETNHSKYHVRFNQRLLDAGIPGLKRLIEEIVSDLKRQRETRSLAFNVAYCCGFESIATFDARYLFERCDEYFEGADPHGANLLLWHVAEEFEHRAVCHEAFRAVRGSYLTRMHGLLYAFWHVGGAFVRAENMLLDHYMKDLPEHGRHLARRRSKALFWRQLRYVVPRMLQVMLPWYHPGKLPVPARIQHALHVFSTPDRIMQRVDLKAIEVV